MITDVSTTGAELALRTGRHRREILWFAVVFVVGATSAAPLMNYTATGLSVVCLILAPAYLLSHPSPRVSVTLAIALAGFLSFIASALSNDVWLLSPGVIGFASFGLYLVGGYVLTGGRFTAVMALLGGVAFGTVAFYLVVGIQLTQTGSLADLWKYGVAPAVTILALLVTASVTRRPFAAPVVLVLLAGVSLVLNYRSHAFVSLTAAAILVATAVSNGRWPKWRIFGSVAGLGVVFYLALPIVARTGILGSALQRKIAFEDDGRTSGIPGILAGRTESPLSLTAIADRPLLGWGTAQNISTDTLVQAKEFAVDLGFSPQFPFDLYWILPNGLVSLHSIVLSSWAEGGVLAALLPVWLLFAAMSLVWGTGTFGRWSAVVTTMAIQAVWDLVFSPWSYNLLPLYACLILVFASTKRRVAS